MKRTPLKRSNKPLRKRSKSKATIDRADRALQDYFRREYPDNKCECCGGQFELMHHHLLKSNSNAGRYNHDNLIFLCKICHARLHFGQLNVISIYSVKRGEEWVNKMAELKKVRKSHYGKKELEEIIQKYVD